MNRKRITATLFSLLLAAAVPAVAAEEPRLDYRRDRVERPAGVRPGTKALPPALAIEAAVPRPEEIEIPRAKSTDGPQIRRHGEVYPKPGYTKPRHPKPGYSGDLAAEARRAGARRAQELVERRGRQEAFEMGFYDGLHTVFDDPRLGRWDYRDGLERGRRSPDAHRLGSDVGLGAAHELAELAAHEAVSAQFHDLSREPGPRPYGSPPVFDAALSRARPPRLEDTFRDLPLSSSHRAAYVEPMPDPWTYYRYSGYDDFYESRWWNTDRAFETWVSRHRSYWRRLNDEEKVYFERVFRAAYLERLPAAYDRVAGRAYHRGFDSGWDYGALVVYEWNYRQGYHEGWNLALAESAEAAYRRGYPEIYKDRYNTYFREWSTSPRPEIGEVVLLDGDGDGVFEPGEALAVEYELINYGGAAGDVAVRLDGGVLERGSLVRFELPRRTVWRSASPLKAAVKASVRPRTTAELELTAAGLERQLPLRVSYPLELDRGVSLAAHDSLAGRAVIEATVRNASRRSVVGDIELASKSTFGPPITRFLDEIEPGGQRRVSFELSGLAPLDLLGGAVEVELTVLGRGRRHDELGYRLPVLALDLDDRGLIEYFSLLARRGAPSHEMREAQELMLRRLSVDWRAVAAERGNAYKKDYKHGTRSSALGDLVATYRSERVTFRHRDVFTALAPRIEELAKTFPGTHPFLRRSMKKLARQLEA